MIEKLNKIAKLIPEDMLFVIGIEEENIFTNLEDTYNGIDIEFPSNRESLEETLDDCIIFLKELKEKG